MSITPQDLRDHEAISLSVPEEDEEGLNECERAEKDYESWAEHRADLRGEDE
jgi:hypothetical protein